MISELRRRVATAVQEAVEATTGERIELPAVEDPPRPEFGDLAVPAALRLARELGRNPREVAEELLAWLEEHAVEGVSRWQIAGPGYLNAFFDKGWVLGRLIESLDATAERAPLFHDGAGEGDEQRKVVVEHTSINPNKAAHIGHLRNACMGDSLARILRHLGIDVEVQNYIDDTGVQVADVVLGFTDLRGLDPAAVAALPEPFDDTCWDLYTEVTERLEADDALQARRREILLALEEGDGAEAEMGSVIADRISRNHIETMERLDIHYDLLVREGDVIRLDLWSEAFDQLEGSDWVYYAEDGKHAGCWMMRLEGIKGFEALEEADKVLVRSNGTATYVAKDIAYHMWKYGLLERDFDYERFVEAPGGHVTWRSTVPGAGDLSGAEAKFGHSDSGVNVIDVRQSYLQQIVGIAINALSEGSGRDVRHTHFAYEMVALTPRTAEALGIPVSEEQRGRQYVEMSGRRGYGVKADDLLDALEERATAEVAERNPELDDEARRELGRQIAVAAARYFLVKFTRNAVIAFDLDDALSFEGETGAYLQYAVVRAGSIFEKMEERWGLTVADAVAAAYAGAALASEGAGSSGELARLDQSGLNELLEEAEESDIWGLVLLLIRFERAVAVSSSTLEPSTLAKYAFSLAQAFNQVYHRYPILQEEDPAQRSLRVLLTHAFRTRLEEACGLLGIPIPRRM